MRRNMKGFTLMEVVIAFVIVAVLAAGTLPALSNINRQSFQTEIDLNLPSVGQAALNGQVSATSLYQELADTTTTGAFELSNGLTKYSATVSSKGYTYAIDTLYADVGVGLGNLSSITGPEEIPATSSTSTTTSVDITDATSTALLQFTGSTIWSATRCPSGLQHDQEDDTASYHDQYVEVRAGTDGIISYGLTFWVPSAANGGNYIIIAIPGNTVREEDEDSNYDYKYSYVVFVNKKPHGSSTEPPSLRRACEDKHGVRRPEQLRPTSTTIELGEVKGSGNGGLFLFPGEDNGTSSTATVVYQYKLSAWVEKKAAWSLDLSIKFLDGTPAANQWVRIYIPNSSGQVTSTIPETTEEVTVTNTSYEPYTLLVYQEAATGLIAWDSITFDVSDNASVTVKVSPDPMDSMTSTYVFHATGPAKPVKINIRQYDLPVDEGLNMWFTVEPIDDKKPATINNVQVFYWTAAPSSP